MLRGDYFSFAVNKTCFFQETILTGAHARATSSAKTLLSREHA